MASEQDQNQRDRLAQTCIAVLCSSSNLKQVKRLIAGITQGTAHPSHDSNESIFPWLIDNKYYTANVTFQLFATADNDCSSPGRSTDGLEWDRCPAVIYAVSSESPATIPPHLASLNSLCSPAEVTLAIILDRPSGLTETCMGKDVDINAVEEAWDAVGFEVLDLRSKGGTGDAAGVFGLTADGDLGSSERKEMERVAGEEDDPDPMERLQEALQTIMWPNLVRKPSRHHHQQQLDQDGDEEDRNTGPSVDPGPPPIPTLDWIHSAMFPTSFGEYEDVLSGFDESIQQNEAAYAARGGILVPDEEFDRLEAWLAHRIDGDDLPASTDDAVYTAKDEKTSPQFEDDFADFVAGPATESPATKTEASASRTQFNPDATLDALLDPTALFLHLQTVRGELGAVVDEDERRMRAGREVERLLMSFGMGGLQEGTEMQDRNEPEGSEMSDRTGVDGASS